MNVTQAAVDKLNSCLTQDSTEDLSVDGRSSNSTSPTLESSPIFQALKGYSLFKHHVKLEAIVDFLRLSSYNPIFISGDPTILAKLECICENPKLVLKGMKSSSKYPSKWTTNFCARFICDVVELIEEDRRVSDSKVARKSPRKGATNTSSLPPAASALFNMYNQARLRVQNESISRKRKTNNNKVKTVRDLLIKSTVHNPEFVEVSSDQILDELLCPICNHRSLVAITTKAEVNMANELIKTAYEKKLNEWSGAGKKGSKPRMSKTESQVLGCVCYMQNCIGNSDGSGCFKCKKLEGKVEKKADKR